MQVSWIDPQDVAALAEHLRTPPPKPAAPPLAEPSPAVLAVEDLNILHDVFVGVGMEEEEQEPEGEATMLPEEPFHIVDSEPEESYADEPLSHVEDTPLPNLTAFRERLQAIRERAIGAGLLPGATAVPAAPPAPAPPVPAVEASTENETEDWVFELPSGTVEERLEAFAAWAYRHIEAGEILVVDDHGDLLWGRHARPELILSTLMARNAASRSSALSACGFSGTIHHTLASGNTLTVIPCDTRLGVIQVAVSATEGLRETDSDRLRQALVAAMDAQG